MNKYNCIVIDPPWNQGKTGKRKVRPNQTTVLDYSTMNKQELLALPVQEWAAENSFLWLWATNSKDKKTKEPILKMAFDLLQEWNFNYYTTITWNKKTGPCPFGPYQVITEHVLFAYKGKVIFPKECLGKMQTLFTEPQSMHSVKPAWFYEQIAKWFDGPKLDVFARQARPGFDGWGDEYGTLSESVKKPRSLKQLRLGVSECLK
jgi:N6-adenosine-specific RNA methylase IME4